MIVDTLFLLIIAYSAYKGLSKGLIMAVFSFASLFVGMAAALKLSSLAASWLGRSDALPSQWWPVVAFLLVYVAVLSAVRFLGRMLEKAVAGISLGWVNHVGGFLLYAALYLLLFSVLLFYLVQLNLLSAEQREASLAYPYVAPWGPVALSGAGKVFPFLGDVFGELQRFFEGAGQRLSPGK